MRRRLKILGLLFAGVLLVTVSGHGQGDGNTLPERPDLITIAMAEAVEELERPPVSFPHDLHTDALAEQSKDCTACHLTRDDGRLSLLFQRLEGSTDVDVEDIYHDECIGCHVETASAGLNSGPESCGDCHRKEPAYVSSRVAFGFDKSLHYRHIRANNDKCEPCHHVYDEQTEKLVYIEGQENPCRDCHGRETQENRSSFRVAAHQSCVNCHREIASTRPDDPVGPQSCRGCHDREQQLAIAVVEQPPRLMRGQPDVVLLGAPVAELEFSKVNTVPFSHVFHEQATATCRACHHKELVRCNQCHTLFGSEESRGVTLQQAMHRITSGHSCVGCHNVAKSERQCAGCHDLMEQGRLSEHACGICHAGPPQEELTEERMQIASLDDYRPVVTVPVISLPASDLPDTVVIRTLSGQYPPVTMPHAKILNTLRTHIKNNKIATRFHGHEDVVCQGCHHHGATGKRPALCENCHGEPFRESDLRIPGLKGAYHRQCLGCHLSMELQAASNCTICHGDINLFAEMTSRLQGEGADR